MIYFVDDLNLPEVDKYGTQSSIALLRQHIDYGHWYDQAKLALKNVDDCHYIAALNPTAGSFHVDPRLQRHFSTFAVAMPSATSLMTIYETFLLGHLSNGGFANSVQGIASTLIKGALSVHKEVGENFRKTAANFHYEFNIRHLANVFQGLLVATPSNFPIRRNLCVCGCTSRNACTGIGLCLTMTLPVSKSSYRARRKRHSCNSICLDSTLVEG